MRSAFVITVLSCLVIGLAVPVLAVTDGDVVIAYEVVLRIRFPAGGLSVKERTDIVTQRINNLLGSKPFDPSDVRVDVRNKEYVVLVGEKLIITADKQTAEFNQATPEQLANIWADNLRRVIPKAKAETD